MLSVCLCGCRGRRSTSSLHSFLGNTLGWESPHTVPSSAHTHTHTHTLTHTHTTNASLSINRPTRPLFNIHCSTSALPLVRLWPLSWETAANEVPGSLSRICNLLFNLSQQDWGLKTAGYSPLRLGTDPSWGQELQ